MIDVDRPRSGDLQEAVGAVSDYGKLICLDAGGWLFLSAVDTYGFRGLHSLDLGLYQPQWSITGLAVQHKCWLGSDGTLFVYGLIIGLSIFLSNFNNIFKKLPKGMKNCVTGFGLVKFPNIYADNCFSRQIESDIWRIKRCIRCIMPWKFSFSRQ